MEKCSKKSKQLCLSLFKPSVMMLTTGFLCMASFQGLAAVEPSHNYGPNVESVMQNGKTVTVKVSDSMGELIGANVLVKGTTIGNVTDMNGSVTLQDVPANAILEISYIGYKTQTIEVGDLGVLNVKMEGDNEVLDEVVVVGAGTQKKVSITGAITATEGIQLKAPTSSLTSSLAGKLAGVISTNSSGEPGSTSAFYIRGINTFGGVATPLILLDGVEISSGDLKRIQAGSIESF